MSSLLWAFGDRELTESTADLIKYVLVLETKHIVQMEGEQLRSGPVACDLRGLTCKSRGPVSFTSQSSTLSLYKIDP